MYAIRSYYGAVDGDLGVPLPRRRFGQADRGHRRVGEDHAGDVVVVDPAFGLVVEQAVRETAARRDGHRGQRRAPGDVADGVDAGDIGVLVVVRRHDTVAAYLVITSYSIHYTKLYEGTCWGGCGSSRRPG